MEQKSKECSEINTSIEKIEQDLKDHKEMEVNTKNDLKVFQNDMQNAEAKMQQLESENEWIKVERNHFGISGHFYDFENKNMSDLSIKVKKMGKEIEE